MIQVNHTLPIFEIYRKTIKSRQSEGHNVYVNGMHVGSYTGPVNLENEVEFRAGIIVEAGNVAAETSLTPRQLLDQRNELLKALEGIAYVANQEGRLYIEQKARAAIAKTRGEA